MYLSIGIKLTKVHRILKFKQSDSLEKYIDFNTDKMKNAANTFEKKKIFKLMDNRVFGKTMENQGKSIIVKLVKRLKTILSV